MCLQSEGHSWPDPTMQPWWLRTCAEARVPQCAESYGILYGWWWVWEAMAKVRHICWSWRISLGLWSKTNWLLHKKQSENEIALRDVLFWSLLNITQPKVASHLTANVHFAAKTNCQCHQFWSVCSDMTWRVLVPSMVRRWCKSLGFPSPTASLAQWRQVRNGEQHSCGVVFVH